MSEKQQKEIKNALYKFAERHGLSIAEAEYCVMNRLRAFYGLEEIHK